MSTECCKLCDALNITIPVQIKILIREFSPKRVDKYFWTKCMVYAKLMCPKVK